MCEAQKEEIGSWSYILKRVDIGIWEDVNYVRKHREKNADYDGIYRDCDGGRKRAMLIRRGV